MSTSQLEEGPRLLRVDQVAERLQLSRSRVYELIASKELRSLTIGASRRITAEAVSDFIQQLTSA